jgi:hypothetical protein
MGALYTNTVSFVGDNVFGVAVVFLLLVIAALVRANLGLVAARGPTSVNYAVYENLVSSPKQAFCKTHDSLKEREDQCNELAEGPCKSAGCCVWAHTKTGDAACVAGDHHGPVYHSDPHAELSYDITKYVHKGEEFAN